MLFDIIDIFFSCTPRLFISETMGHHERASISDYMKDINAEMLIFRF